MDNWILFGEGLISGITLTLMIGPVTMIILRSGIEINRKAGVYAAAGTWVSDFIFIAITYWMTAVVENWSSDPSTRLKLYLVGGAGLLLIGLFMMRVKKKTYNQVVYQDGMRYIKAFFSGFLINTLSPFTLFFWLGAAVFLHLQKVSPLYYYSGLMLTLGIGDFTKAWIAPRLTKWLKEHHIYWFQIVAGILIACTGGYIIYLGFAG